MRALYAPSGPARRPLLVACFALLSGAAAAQTCPASGTTLFPGLDGQQLRDSLAANYYPAQTLSYDNARDVMYATLDNVSGVVTCRYSGYTANIPYGAPNARALATAQDLNAEHTWPQSMGAENAPMHDDLHHLYPVYESVNSARNNHPFAEIPDDQTNAWYRLTENTATPNPLFLNEYSERDGTHPDPAFDDRFEPREDHKGNAARSMFYFYTMYQAAADAANPAFFPVQRDDLRGWVVADPVTQAEYDRTCTIQGVQGNVNPFVIDPTLVERAFFSGELLATVQFTTSAGSVREDASAPVSVSVSILGAHDDEATTVEVALTGGTATNGTDIASFSTTTLTFPAGSGTPQTFSVTPQNDGAVEGNETLVFSLQGVSANGRLGSPATFTLTLTDDDGAAGLAWINEFHYDNASTDVNEMIEIVLPDTVAVGRATITLYNGNGGAPYATYAGSTLTAGESVAGRRIYHVVLPANGMQNDTDGLALDIDGQLVQFLSYEGTFTAVGGPADGIVSTAVGVGETGTTPTGTSVSLQGAGSTYAGFAWASGVTATPGAVNAGQTIAPVTAAEGEAPAHTAALHVLPHPVAGRASVVLDVPAAGLLRVALFDVLGRRVAVLHDGTAPAGTLRLALDAAGLPPGTYVLAADGPELVLRRPVTVVR